MSMADAEPSDAAARTEDAKVREEWRRLERKRIEDEIAEAREDAVAADAPRSRRYWLVWVAFVVALAAGIAVTALINGCFEPRP